MLIAFGIGVYKYRALIKTRISRLWGKPENRWQVEAQKHQLYDAYLQNISCVMLGNSITQQAQWNELLNRNDIANRAISGETISGMLQRLPAILALKPKLIFVMAGINDIIYRGHHAEAIFKEYKQLLDSILAHHVEPVVTSTLFVTYDSGINQQVAVLNQLLVQYCQQQQIRFVDLNRSLSKDGLLLSEFSYDGIHINDKAYKIWRVEVYQIIEEKVDKPIHDN